jgi:cell wall-associated NlpC family hydrolase
LVTIAAAAVGCALLGAGLTSASADLQGQIAAGQSAASALTSQIAQDTARIRQTAGGIASLQRQLDGLQAALDEREAQLAAVQRALLAARNRLVDLENRLQIATAALSQNLVAQYEGEQPDLVSVVLESHGFNDLLEQLQFLQRMGHMDAQVISSTRAARLAVTREAISLGSLEQRDRTLTEQVLAQRNEVAALRVRLVNQEAAQLRARSGAGAKLAAVSANLHTLEARAAAQAAAAAAAANGGPTSVGPLAIDTGGMVQPPPGAPAAVAEVIAAANAIATLPYVYGGGHASFHADGYDCSGSVSYALAAAGLVSSPLDSTGFESWGAPGPGRWITVYANAGHAWMEVAGWRFDTVAQAQTGTRWAQGGGEFAGFVARHPPGL